MKNQTAEITWCAGDVPVSAVFDDPYFSLENGLAESRHVFLAGNDLPERFATPIQIAELGFGTGLNFLATLRAWQDAGASHPLRYTAFEAYPMRCADMARALARFDEVAHLVPGLVAGWNPRGGDLAINANVTLTLVVGDARDTLPGWPKRADAWFLDGFSPARNPQLWSPQLMSDVAQHTSSGGTFATYTAAGFVRRGLQEAGFDVTRVPGYGRKRHMTRGVRRP